MEGVMYCTRHTGAGSRGLLLASREPLSFWGLHQKTGGIIDRRHPLSSKNACGKILAVPFSRGSSITAVLLEAIRNHKAPNAILTLGIDQLFVLASVVADEMYGTPMVVASLSDRDFNFPQTGRWVEITPEAQVVLRDH